MHRSTSAAVLACFAATSLATAQQLIQPSAGLAFNSFSGYGQIPFEYITSNPAITAIDVSAAVTNANGHNDTYTLARGLQASSGNTINAVFAPVGGWCGAVTLQVAEISGDPSVPTVSRNITVNCDVIQLVVPASGWLEKRQDSGPSGTLTAPGGGQAYNQEGTLSLQYQPVTQGGQTFGIDASLAGPAGNFTVGFLRLANGLFKSNSSSTITARFALPASACGDFELAIIEHQLYQNTAIQFQAAAPNVTIVCATAVDPNATAASVHNVTSTATVLPVATSAGANSTSILVNSTTTSRPAATNSTSTLPRTSTSSISSSSTITTSSIPAVVTPGTASSTTSSASSESATSSSISTSTATPSSTGTSSAVTTSSTSTSSTTSTSTSTSTITSSSTSTSSAETTSLPESTVTMTTSSSHSGTVAAVTSVVTQTAEPNTTTSAIVGSVSTTTLSSSSSTSQDTTTARPSNVTTIGIVPASTITVTQQPTGSQGVTTIIASPPSEASVTISGTTTSPISRSSITSIYTTTEVVVVAEPQQSSSTSTRVQTVILITPTIAAVVTPSSTPVPTTKLSGGAIAIFDSRTLVKLFVGLGAVVVTNLLLL
ncbi:MAG: hypothetical protein CYPHOPRED_001434 [Cyphobasidiales sp. Tagirdzhanova-0007]|nr:MAG: hypothetical protein CYPHOPRED_001434 [Cyphobasidiales sp. Tagirdzhanova-0007]